MPTEGGFGEDLDDLRDLLKVDFDLMGEPLLGVLDLDLDLDLDLL